MKHLRNICSIEIFPKHFISYSEPENFNPDDRYLFYDENFSFEIPAVQLFELRQTLVNNRTVLLKHVPIFKFTIHKKPTIFQLCRDWVRLTSQKKEIQNYGILGVQEWSNNYFHWMTEVLPHIVVMHQANPTIPILIPSNYLHYKFIQQSLERLKIAFKTFDVKAALKVKMLFAIPVPHVGRFNEGLLHSFRDTFIKPVNEIVNPYRLLYISRDKAKRRKVSNELELSSFLTSKGFEKVFLEDYTLDEQIELMKQSKLVISCHGAGLTNIMFMQKSQIVIELKSKNNNYWCYFSLARVFGLDYNYILCEGDNENHRDANIKVDLHELSDLLENFFHSNNLQFS
jgi:capsular polysaccharide biosynthesis protein